MIDIKKLETYLNENCDEQDSSAEESKSLFSQKNPLVDFARVITGRKSVSFNPIRGLSSSKEKELKIKLDETKYNDFISKFYYYLNLKGMTKPQVYKTAGLNADCISKITTSKTGVPKKNTVIAIVFALRLTLDEATDLLSSAGYCLTNFKQDLIYRFCLEEGDSIDDLNYYLNHYGFPTIGGVKDDKKEAKKNKNKFN